MSAPRRVAPVLAILALAIGGCGGENQAPSPQAEAPSVRSTEESPTQAGSTETARTILAVRPPGVDGLRVPAERAKIVARQSRFGEVLFDANGQVVYVFEIDRQNRSNCTSAECVKAWPPVLTREPPSAGAGIDEGLLGTIRRSDEQLQVTYNGRPLYFYEHEGPGEIGCHNVNLHGGLWWVVTPSGIPAD